MKILRINSIYLSIFCFSSPCHCIVIHAYKPLHFIVMLRLFGSSDEPLLFVYGWCWYINQDEKQKDWKTQDIVLEKDRLVVDIHIHSAP